MAKSDGCVVRVGNRWFVAWYDANQYQWRGPLMSMSRAGGAYLWYAWTIEQVARIADRSYAHKRSAVRAARRVYGDDD